MRATALDIFEKTLEVMQPEQLVSNAVSINENLIKAGDHHFKQYEINGIYILGAGKASARMAEGINNAIGEYISEGMVIAPTKKVKSIGKIRVLPGSHPQPNEDTLTSTKKLIQLASQIPDDALVFFLISGGTSSLLELPADGIELEDISEAYKAILKSGASIHEMNLIRKQLSDVKGGKLLRYLPNCTLVNLILSDVPGDDPRHIGSGPTTPDASIPADALELISRYNMETNLPKPVIQSLEKRSKAQETSPKKIEPVQILLGTSLKFAASASRFAAKYGYKAKVEPSAYDEPAETLVERMVEDIASNTSGKYALLYHGESTIQVTGNGKGGRNQHVALLLADKLRDEKGWLALSAGTDGGDGPTDAAGAFADGETVKNGLNYGMQIEDYIRNFNAYPYFKTLDSLIFTGPTGNNLMDFQLILIDR